VTTTGTPPPPPSVDGEGDDGGDGSSPWGWIAGLLGIGILAIVGFLVLRMLTGGGGEEPSASPGESPSGATVAVPAFVDMTIPDAQAAADAAGLVLVIAGTEERTDVDPDIVLTQDPAAGVPVAEGSEVSVTVSRGKVAVAVPDLRDKPRSEALQLIVQEGLTVGEESKDFSPSVAAGLVMAQNPGPGIVVAPGTSVDYTISEGPEPTPSPTPTPTPTPVPTPTPTPAPVNVGDYTCNTVEVAKTLIDADTFAVGSIVSDPAGTDPVPDTWIVTAQDPKAGQKQPVGTSINLTAQDPATQTVCP
jgi:beta-lactam-binding protein with PASTA domain